MSRHPFLLALVIVGLLMGCSSTPPPYPGVYERKERAADYLNYGKKAFIEAQYEQALAYYDLAFAINTSVDYEAGMAIVLNHMAITQTILGRPEAGKEALAQAETLAARAGDQTVILQVAVSRVQSYLTEGKTGDARKRLAELQPFPATAEGAALEHVQGLLEKDLGNFPAALAAFDRALTLNTKLNLKQEMATNRFMRATIMGRDGRWDQAKDELQKALDLDRLMENTVGIGQDWRALGTVALRLQQPAEAFEAYVRAYRVYHAAGLANEQRKTLELLIPVARDLGLDNEVTRYQGLLQQLGSPAP